MPGAHSSGLTDKLNAGDRSDRSQTISPSDSHEIFLRTISASISDRTVIAMVLRVMKLCVAIIISLSELLLFVQMALEESGDLGGILVPRHFSPQVTHLTINCTDHARSSDAIGKFAISQGY